MIALLAFIVPSIVWSASLGSSIIATVREYLGLVLVLGSSIKFETSELDDFPFDAVFWSHDSGDELDFATGLLSFCNVMLLGELSSFAGDLEDMSEIIAL